MHIFTINRNGHNPNFKKIELNLINKTSQFTGNKPTKCQARPSSKDHLHPRTNIPSDWENLSESYRVPSLDYGDIISYFLYTCLYFLILVLFMYIFIQKDIKRFI